MFKKVLFLVSVLQIMTLVVCFSQTAHLAKKISISVKNEKLETVLGIIEKKGNFTFSYNTAIFNSDEQYTLSVSNKSIYDILSSLLGNKYNFTEFKNQVLISIRKGELPEKQKRINTKIKIDSIYVIKTDSQHIKINDTVHVSVTDTIQVYDTIIVSKNQKSKEKSNLSVSVNFSQSTISATEFTNTKNNASLVDFIKSSEDSYSSLSYGMAFDYTLSKLRMGLGINVSELKKPVHYSYEKEYFDYNNLYTDSSYSWEYKTILTYYKFKDGDTVRIPLIDSNIIVKTFTHAKHIVEKNNIAYTNSIKTICIPLTVGYPIKITNKSLFIPSFQLNTYFVTQVKGYFYDINKETLNAINKQSVRSILFSSGFSFRYEYAIHSNATFYIEPTISQFVNTIYNDHRKINERMAISSISFGLRTHLFEK